MVQRIKGLGVIDWFDKNTPLTEANYQLLNKLPFKLPEKFINLLKVANGGTIDYNFNYFDIALSRINQTCISEIFGLGVESTKMHNRNYNPIAAIGYDSKEFFEVFHDIIGNYFNSPEFFPRNVLAFGTNGAGDMICFDYRKDSKTENPPVVYWRMGPEEEKAVSPVADNFEEFLGMLKEPEDKEEYSAEEIQEWLKKLP